MQPFVYSAFLGRLPRLDQALAVDPVDVLERAHEVVTAVRVGRRHAVHACDFERVRVGADRRGPDIGAEIVIWHAALPSASVVLIAACADMAKLAIGTKRT